MTILSGKTAIIYGGAGGIGTGIAHAFAREGAHVHWSAARAPVSTSWRATSRGWGHPACASAVSGRPAWAETLTREKIATMAARRRTPRLADVAEVATFLASDRAGGITGTMTNVTCVLVLR